MEEREKKCSKGVSKKGKKKNVNEKEICTSDTKGD